ncbi:MAG TPA: XdhC family protein [Ferruginibacter sp.]|nr:XdhC family protein [Ferruginibacter sp.]
MNVWQFIQDKSVAMVPVILLYVLHSEGSSPGRQGFKMAVAGDNHFCGSIGGGIMEYKFVEMAKAKLAEEAGTADIYRQVHDKAAGNNKSGMICSGEQTIFLYRVQPTDMEAIKALILSVEQNENGSLMLSNIGIQFSTEVPAKNFLFQQIDETAFTLTEKTGFKNQLHIIGGGHCALALSKLMGSMDFYIRLYDERNGLNTMEQNIYAHEKQLVNSYTDLQTMITSGENVFVVIMTFGYRTDDLALRALMKHSFAYLGVMGSRKKMEKMFTDYRQEHITEAVLQKIKTPIGIPIKSQTPEEIAVSIAAEIIAVKNAR